MFNPAAPVVPLKHAPPMRRSRLGNFRSELCSDGQADPEGALARPTRSGGLPD